MPRNDEVIGKGIKPIRNAIAYEVTLPDGTVELSTIVAYKLDTHNGYRAWVYHPRMGAQLMDPSQGYLQDSKPIIALTQDDIPVLVQQIVKDITEPLLARISALEEQLVEAEAVNNRLSGLESALEEVQALLVPEDMPAPTPEPVTKKSTARA